MIGNRYLIWLIAINGTIKTVKTEVSSYKFFVKANFKSPYIPIECIINNIIEITNCK